MTDQAGIAAAAQRQRERIEQDGFARAGFAGQHREAPGKLDIEPFDQDDVTDRQTRQHADRFLMVCAEVLFFPRESVKSTS